MWGGGGTEGLVAFRVGFDDVINNELSGVFIRNDTNSEVIKLRSLRLPGERWREETSACGLKSPARDQNVIFHPRPWRKARNGRCRRSIGCGVAAAAADKSPEGETSAGLGWRREGFSFRGKSATRVNHPCCQINKNSGVNLFRSRSCYDFSRNSYGK